MNEFSEEIKQASKTLVQHTDGCIAVSAGCQIFARYTSRMAAETTEVGILFLSLLLLALTTMPPLAYPCVYRGFQISD